MFRCYTRHHVIVTQIIIMDYKMWTSTHTKILPTRRLLIVLQDLEIKFFFMIIPQIRFIKNLLTIAVFGIHIAS
jgi:hypothetical protein